jgi:DNA-binding GntR family transcriptional regulator
VERLEVESAQMSKLRRSTLTSDAYGVVRAMLLDNDRFQPGQKISIEMISRELGVSRSPVWSAIARLDAEGLVVVSPRQGVYLVAFDEERLCNLFETREALEGMATRLAASRITQAELDALATQVKHQKTLLSHLYEAEFAASTLEFHERILRGARNSHIEQHLSGIYARISAMCRGRTSEHISRDLTAIYKGHCAILKALRRRDEVASEALARAHVRLLKASRLRNGMPPQQRRQNASR